MSDSKLTKEDFQDILDNIIDSVSVMDKNGVVMWANKVNREKLGLTDEVIGKEVKQLVQEGLIDKAIVYDAIKSGKLTTAMITKGKEKDVIVHCSPVYDEEGKIKFLVSSAVICSEVNNIVKTLETERRINKKYLAEIKHLRNTLLLGEDFVIESTNMKLLLEDVEKLAPIDCSVLVTGESGVGKEVMVKTIHKNSNRKDGPFITVSIPSIPDNLLEAELFGYEEGAFTGANRGGKIGLFELAQGGTLFLDEVGDIPYALQVKLLRAIENGEIRRLGGTKIIKIDTRIIAATNKNLEQMIKKGLFREDLFYRLSVMHLQIKPLRERLEDIKPLCERFIQNFNNKYTTEKEISESAFNLMKKYA